MTAQADQARRTARRQADKKRKAAMVAQRQAAKKDQA